MNKNHAKDYLIEYANSLTNKDWLKCLIIEAINTNGNISQEKLDEIYLNLTKNQEISVPTIDNRGTQTDSILLHSLKHISGINALANDQTITFSPDVTILHSMNGAGKSSYFRILNEVTGGNQIKEIFSNIYTDTPEAINVEIKFKKKTTTNTNIIIWDGAKRALPELNYCSVFDSSYLAGFLQVRSIDETLILPLGLKLFTYIASKIDEFKIKLNKDSLNIKCQKPNIDYTKFSEELKTALANNNISPEIRTKIESCYNFNEEDEKQLTNVQKQLKGLKQVNIADRIALINKNKRAYVTCKKQLDSTYQAINNIIPKIANSIQIYIERKEKNIEAKNQFTVFRSIPDSNTQEWKQFIQAAHKYHPQKDKIICPYCRQVLQTEESKSLLKAYFAFMTDKTADELKEAEQNLQDIQKHLDSINLNLVLSEEVENVIDFSLKQDFLQNLNIIKIIKSSLCESIHNKELINSTPSVPNFEKIITAIDIECKKIEQELEVLNQSPDKKIRVVESLEQNIKLLEEKKDISKQRDQFISWFQYDELEKKLQYLADDISTMAITKLSNKAHEELLTEKLKDNFTEELKELKKQGLQVELIKAGNSKGKQNTKLILNRKKNVTEILSEGEQKAIGLALFLAEIRSSDTHNPIILDDPVNSLDHQIASAFAARLLKLDNQIIIFNHNMLFLDAFECARNHHICKSDNSACNNTRGKHIKIYQVCDEGQNLKGVISDYKQNKAERHIKNAEKILNKSPFNDTLKVSALIRRAVECSIDEVVFKCQCPTKYSTKNSRIDWNALKIMGANNDVIDKLHNIHDRVSGGELHNGSELTENPIRKDEFVQFVDDIKSILSANKETLASSSEASE